MGHRGTFGCLRLEAEKLKAESSKLTKAWRQNGGEQRI
jgi:hypothetical protein